jgi:hypothetical protein
MLNNAALTTVDKARTDEAQTRFRGTDKMGVDENRHDIILDSFTVVIQDTRSLLAHEYKFIGVAE